MLEISLGTAHPRHALYQLSYIRRPYLVLYELPNLIYPIIEVQNGVRHCVYFTLLFIVTLVFKGALWSFGWSSGVSWGVEGHEVLCLLYCFIHVCHLFVHLYSL